MWGFFKIKKKRNPPFLREGQSKDTILRGVKILGRYLG
jgi:hypothetical protein